MSRQTDQPQTDLEHPKPAKHNDDRHSRMPERHDTRKRSPADKPGQKPGEGEPPVG
jgi:hypothetical protein